MNQLTLRPAILQFAEATGFLGLLPAGGIEQGLADFEGELLRIATDAFVAEQRRVPVHLAANDHVNFPRLAAFHVGLKDVLTKELPPDFAKWARGLFARPECINGSEIQIALGRLAVASEQPLLGALVRCLLFEAVRFSLLIVDHVPQASSKVVPSIEEHADRARAGMEGLGLLGVSLDEVAAREVAWWIENAQRFEGDVRPVSVLFASAMVQLREHAEDLKRALTQFNADVVEELKQRDEIERRLKRMNAPDAVLIRNGVVHGLGRRSADRDGNASVREVDAQRVSIEILQQQHPVALGEHERNALDQRFHRLRGRLEAGDMLERKNPALIDLVAEQLEREEP